MTRREPVARPESMDWDDVRVFLAIARKGSMRAAGRSLGLSQPTIARRLEAFEATFGGTALFDRLPEHEGQVRLDGEVWTARPYSAEDVFEPGDHVTVVHIDGATAVVQKLA